MTNEEDKPLLDEDNSTGDGTYTASVKNNFLSSLRNKASNKEAPEHFKFFNVFSNIVSEEATEPDVIICVFVAKFDTRCGNSIEWSMPNDVDLGSVEFKAIPSGSHTIDSDFIYFRIGNLFGLCCFEKMRLDSDIERGARMKSVGIVAPSYTTLHQHMQFLESQVRHQLQTPGNYEQLVELYNDRCGVLPSTTQQPSSTNEVIPRRLDNQFPQMKITHPAGCFLQFLQFFGENIFVLWKHMLLRKRILFFSPPPVGVVCYKVYCACCLGKITLSGYDQKPVVPYFYVNIADIGHLETEMTFVACTTESIFKEKAHLYDVYVDNQVIKSTNDHLKLTKVDKENYKNLLNYSRDYVHQEELGASELPSEEQLYQSFFTQLNNQLFQILYDTSISHDRTLTEDHLRAMGLDPVADRLFVMDLLELYAIDVVLVADNPCCPV